MQHRVLRAAAHPNERWAAIAGAALLSGLLWFFANPPTAHACGGCFHAENTTGSVVTGHRMALSISAERTVLWDQVTYSGDPEDFAWVLPVGPGAYLELGTDAWFETLEAVTSTRVMSRAVTCEDGRTVRQGSGSSGGCTGSTMSSPGSSRPASSDDSDPARRRQGDEDVTVLHEGTVGPYETATVSSTDPEALRDWLTTHQYVIPPEIDPVIDDYVAEGADFIALRLAPDAGVRQMQPVRVITPGASPILPLKMVAAGTGAQTSIVLYVIGEGRYDTANFDGSTVSPSDLSWDWSAQRSNYAELRSTALEDNRFLTSFAKPGAIHEPLEAVEGELAEYGVGTVARYDTLADLYFARAQRNGEADPDCPVLETRLATDDRVVDTCDAMGECTEAGAGEIAAIDLACGYADDIAAALVGMHPRDVWVTRLEADLDRNAFSRDLALEATTQTQVHNWHVAPNDEGLPCTETTAATDDDEPVSTSSDGGTCFCRMGHPGPSPLAAGTFVAGVLLALRRRRTRRGGYPRWA